MRPTLNFSRRRVLAVGAALVAAPSVLRAQSWPSGLITIVVPFPPGGSVDALARLAQTGLQQELGVTVIVENKPGASGSLGANQVAKSKADGNTWLFVFDTHGVNPSLYPNLPFDTMNDLDPVTLIGTAPHIIATHPTKAYKSWTEMLAATRAQPGGLNYGSIGTGSLGHLTMLQLAKRGSFPATHIPFRGGGPLMTDMVAGKIDLGIASTGLFGPQLNAKTIVPLLQTGVTRLPSLPDLPTAREVGFADFESVAWWGVFAPKGTAPDIVNRFRAALVKTYQAPQTAKVIQEAQQIAVSLGEPAQLKSFLAQQIETWRPVIRDNEIRPGN